MSNISLVFCHDNQVADNKMQFNNNEDTKKSLNDSRFDIDSIDNQIWDFISQRLSLAKNIVAAKAYLGLPMTDQSRELIV
jgi:chorismate mutase